MRKCERCTIYYIVARRLLFRPYSILNVIFTLWSGGFFYLHLNSLENDIIIFFFFFLLAALFSLCFFLLCPGKKNQEIASMEENNKFLFISFANYFSNYINLSNKFKFIVWTCLYFHLDLCIVYMHKTKIYL